MKRFETKVPPVIWWAWGALVVVIVDVIDGSNVLGNVGRVIGVVFLIAGVGVALSALLQFRQAETTFDPHHPDNTNSLVTDGIYRFTRNPMYLGLLCLAIGWGFWRGTLIGAALGALVFVGFVTIFQIRPEERVLEEKFGDAFVAYKTQTRRWI